MQNLKAYCMLVSSKTLPYNASASLMTDLRRMEDTSAIVLQGKGSTIPAVVEIGALCIRELGFSVTRKSGHDTSIVNYIDFSVGEGLIKKENSPFRHPSVYNRATLSIVFGRKLDSCVPKITAVDDKTIYDYSEGSAEELAEFIRAKDSCVVKAVGKNSVLNLAIASVYVMESRDEKRFLSSLWPVYEPGTPALLAQFSKELRARSPYMYVGVEQ